MLFLPGKLSSKSLFCWNQLPWLVTAGKAPWDRATRDLCPGQTWRSLTSAHRHHSWAASASTNILHSVVSSTPKGLTGRVERHFIWSCSNISGQAGGGVLPYRHLWILLKKHVTIFTTCAINFRSSISSRQLPAVSPALLSKQSWPGCSNCCCKWSDSAEKPRPDWSWKLNCSIICEVWRCPPKAGVWGGRSPPLGISGYYLFRLLPFHEGFFFFFTKRKTTGMHLYSLNHRRMEVAQEFRKSSCSSLLHKQANLELVAQGHFQMAFGPLQGWRLHSLPGQLVPMLNHPHS